MIELILSDGTAIEFPDGTPPDKIAAAVAGYYGVETPEEAPEAPPAVPVAEPASDAPHEPETPSDQPSDPPARTLVRSGPAFQFEFGEFQRDDDVDREEQTARLIEALQQRSGNPDARHPVHTPPPPSDPGRDNFLWLKPRR